jgi:hypothetical protein
MPSPIDCYAGSLKEMLISELYIPSAVWSHIAEIVEIISDSPELSASEKVIIECAFDRGVTFLSEEIANAFGEIERLREG